MKKFKKVLSFVAAMAMAMVLPLSSMADVTLYVEKPADWDSVYFWCWDAQIDGATADAAFNPEDVPSAWPGWEFKKDDATGYYKYETKLDAFSCCFAGNAEGSVQTADITGITEGTYTFSNGKVEKMDVNGEEKDRVVFTQASGAPTGSASTDSTPKTADLAPIGIVAVIGLASVVVVLATRKKAIA